MRLLRISPPAIALSQVHRQESTGVRPSRGTFRLCIPKNHEGAAIGLLSKFFKHVMQRMVDRFSSVTLRMLTWKSIADRLRPPPVGIGGTNTRVRGILRSSMWIPPKTSFRRLGLPTPERAIASPVGNNAPALPCNVSMTMVLPCR